MSRANLWRTSNKNNNTSSNTLYESYVDFPLLGITAIMLQDDKAVQKLLLRKELPAISQRGREILMLIPIVPLFCKV